jgi:hypothetical protein
MAVTSIVLGGNERREGNAVQASVTPAGETLGWEGKQQLERNEEEAPRNGRLPRICFCHVFQLVDLVS